MSSFFKGLHLCRPYNQNWSISNMDLKQVCKLQSIYYLIPQGQCPWVWPLHMPVLYIWVLPDTLFSYLFVFGCVFGKLCLHVDLWYRKFLSSLWLWDCDSIVVLTGSSSSWDFWLFNGLIHSEAGVSSFNKSRATDACIISLENHNIVSAASEMLKRVVKPWSQHYSSVHYLAPNQKFSF